MTITSFPAATAAPAEWISWCLDRLKVHEQSVDCDPMTNSVRSLAYELFQALQTDALNRLALSGLAKNISDEALLERAATFALSHQIDASTDDLVRGVLGDLDGKSFADVAAALAPTRAGVVFTAHPTFAMSTAMRQAVADYASATGDDADKKRANAIKSIAKLPHAPDKTITLVDEHEAVEICLTRSKTAIRNLTSAIFDWARDRFPNDWTSLNPRPISLASWVGYDLDGRTDIHWSETFRLRLDEKAKQLRYYSGALASVDAGAQNPLRDRLVDQLNKAADLASQQADLFDGDFTNPARTAAAANFLTADHPHRLTSLTPMMEALSNIIDAIGDDDARLALCTLRTEMSNYGLGVALIHLRVNAAQVRSALRSDLGLEQGREFVDRTALSAAAEKARSVSTQRISIASIFLEQMTARRQLMLTAEFLKHIDADSPIRFLIAECEAPATVMGAVYLARLYGIAHQLDISPLFETPEAIESGGRFIERLLEQEEFVDYIRERRRLSIQIGFSDAGRFMGQISANLAIERLQIVIARALAAKGVKGVEVLLFNTHGESMGRGGYPGTLHERFDYLLTPWTRARYAHESLAINAECSFQGGDGFIHFGADELATATVNALLAWGFQSPEADRTDRFYADINFSWDFYRGIKTWQETLFDDPDYQVTIGAFAPDLLVTTGSRKVRRQSGAVITGPRSLRAIPHNAILQQLAAPANVVGGVGSAAGFESERLIDHVRGSPRMQQIFGALRAARRVTSLPALRSYGALYDASFWVSKGARENDPAASAACLEIGNRLRDQHIPTAISRFANHLGTDLATLDHMMVELFGEESATERRNNRRMMHALHAIRQAMIMEAFVTVASVPEFSQRHDVSRARLFELTFALKFEEVAALIEAIFPAANDAADALNDITEPSDNIASALRGYPEIHENIIAPLREIETAIREIGVGLSHYYRAYG